MAEGLHPMIAGVHGFRDVEWKPRVVAPCTLRGGPHGGGDGTAVCPVDITVDVVEGIETLTARVDIAPASERTLRRRRSGNGAEGVPPAGEYKRE